MNIFVKAERQTRTTWNNPNGYKTINSSAMMKIKVISGVKEKIDFAAVFVNVTRKGAPPE